MPLPIEWADCVQAPPGKILVERVEMPVRRGKILLPDGYTGRTRSTEAVIRSRGGQLAPFPWVGQRVLISGSVGKSIPFGIRGERTLWLCDPSAILAILRDEGVEQEPENPLAHVERAGSSALDMRFDEGDLRGPR
jgi:hypothetical protein